MNLEAEINGTSIPIRIDKDTQTYVLPDTAGTYHVQPMYDGRHLMRIGEKLFRIDGVHIQGNLVEFSINGQFQSVRVHDEQALMLRNLGFKPASSSSQGRLLAPMPGKIIAVLVKENDVVEHGQPVVVLEAMKMENELKAPVSGKVVSIAAEIGSSVEKNELLIELEPIG